MWLVLEFSRLKYINQDNLKPQLCLRVGLHLLWSSENGWRLINSILMRKCASLSAWEIRTNIILFMNFQNKLLSNNLKLLECVILKLKSLSVPLCISMSLPCYIFKLLSFLLLSELYFWHKTDASWSPSLKCPHGRAIRIWSLTKFSVYLLLFREMKSPEQRYLWTGHLGSLELRAAEPSGTGHSHGIAVKSVLWHSYQC